MSIDRCCLGRPTPTPCGAQDPYKPAKDRKEGDQHCTCDLLQGTVLQINMGGCELFCSGLAGSQLENELPRCFGCGGFVLPGAASHQLSAGVIAPCWEYYAASFGLRMPKGVVWQAGAMRAKSIAMRLILKTPHPQSCSFWEKGGRAGQQACRPLLAPQTSLDPCICHKLDQGLLCADRVLPGCGAAKE